MYIIILFLNGEFEQAKPALQKLVKQAPSNANYNYWYGACCYETGEKKEAQPYLEKSAARKVIDAYRYLGKLYYDIYRFDDAVDNYEQHIEWLEKKKRPTEMAEAELEQIKQAARMIKGVENSLSMLGSRKKQQWQWRQESQQVVENRFMEYIQHLYRELTTRSHRICASIAMQQRS